MILSVVAAMGLNGVIGDDKGLPWHLPIDLKRFKALTLGKPVIMGRKTADLIGKPLPGRHNIVLTRDRSRKPTDGLVIVHSMKDALIAASEYLSRHSGDEVMVIGGGKVYGEFVQICERLYLTVVLGRFSGTAYFPAQFVGGPEWHVMDWKVHEADERNPFAHLFYVIQKSGSNVVKLLNFNSKESYPVPAIELLEVLDYLAQESPQSCASHVSILS